MPITHRSYKNHQLFPSDLATPSLADGYILGKFAQANLDLKQSWAEEDCVFLFLRAYMFSVSLKFVDQLDNNLLTTELKEQFRANGVDLHQEASVRVKQTGNRWKIVNAETEYEVVRKESDTQRKEDTLNVVPWLTAKLKAYLREPLHRQVRFLWVENPHEPLSQWQSNALSVETNDGESVISQLSYLDLRNYSFSIARGTSIEPDDAATPTGFILKRETANPNGFELAAGYGAHRFHTIGERVRLPMQGEFAGCLQFNFHVNFHVHKRFSIFGVGDINDVPSLINKLQSDSNPVSRFIRSEVERATPDLLADPNSTLQQKQSALVQAFNKLLQGNSIYEPTRFAGVTLRPETQSLIKQSPTGERLIRLNWLLLKDAYPCDINVGVFGYPDLVHLDIGFRFFTRDPDFPESGDNVYLSSHRYPLIDEDSENDCGYAYYPDQIAFKASFDPLYPLAPERTHLTFQSPTHKFAQTGLPSSYRTNLGYSVHLLPVNDQSRLQFGLRPAKPNAEEQAQAPFYLVPKGEYQMVVPRYRADGSVDLVTAANVICGLSGLEYIKVTTDPPVKLTFVPGQPAYAPAYISITALLRDLPTLLESFSKRTLPPDTTDLDMKIEDQEEGEAEEALGISDVERRQILEILRKDYFPPRYQFTQAQLEAYDSLEIVEDLIEWLRITLQAATYDSVSGEGALAAHATTSWVYVRSTIGAVYYAQPDQAPLYTAEASSTQFLDYLEAPSVGLPANLTRAQHGVLKDDTLYESLESLAFPMLPYGNVDSHALADIRQLEIALVNNYRRNRIHKISKATNHVTPELIVNAGSKQFGTTPQGLIATFSDKDRWRIERLQLMKDTKDKSICFVNIAHGSPLKAALQSNQLFMVISDPEAVGTNFSTDVLEPIADATNSLEIKKWVFELGTEHWDKKGTLLIFKFHDKPLLDLAENHDLWSLADDFNGNKAKISQDLVRLLKQAVEIGKSADPKERRKYEVLARAATQPNWTGILALNVHVPLRNLPDTLKALAAGMNPDLFYAQYVGVEVTPVQVNPYDLDLIASSSGKPLPETGKRLIAIAEDNKKALRFRIFNDQGNMAVDLQEAALTQAKSNQLKALKKLLEPHWNSSTLPIPPRTNERILAAVASITDHIELVPQQSSLFGLIDYSNPNIPLADASGYNFHVPLLSIVFQNSEITDFAAEVLIIMDRLFDEATTLSNSPDGKNILRLQGVAEEHNGQVTYSFGFSGANRFLLSGKVMQEVEIVKAQFTTDPISELFGEGSIKNLPALISKLRSDSNQSTKLVSQFIWGKVDPATKELLDVSDSTLEQKQQSALLKALNKILQGEAIYETTRFTDVSLKLETQALIESSPTGERLIRWNRLLFEDAYPLEIERTLPVKGRFFFWGRVKFTYLPDFDVLSFGASPGSDFASAPAPGADPPAADYLSMSNLQVTVEFKLNQTTNQINDRKFKFIPTQLAFDLKRSGWRANSLYEKFPLKFSGFRAIKNDPQALEKSGFMPVKTPGKSAKLGPIWYGLTFELNLGSAGALAGSAGLVVSILAAWNPEKDGLYVGLKLPGSSGGKKEIVIQGLLKITFKSIEFVVYLLPLDPNPDPPTLPVNAERQVGYLLKIKNVMLKFMLLSFPPSGQTEFILFGDPRGDVEREDKLLGWYAAYAREPKT